MVGGTAAAQAIWALTLPIATRLYSPDDFSVLAVFTGLVSILSVAICLRLDIAVPLPEAETDAANLVASAILTAAVLSLVLILGPLFFAEELANMLGQPSLAQYLWMAPVAAFLAGIYSALQFWFVRQEKFSIIAQNRIAQAAVGSLAQISLGMVGIAPLGLILAQTINSGLGAVGLAIKAFSAKSFVREQVSWTRMRQVVARYDRFPKYSTFEAIANSGSIYLPVIFLGALSKGPEAGYLMLAMYAMQVPMSLIGNAISQVYVSRAPDELRAGRLGIFTTDVLAGLLRIGVGPICFAGIVAPDIFEFVFGPDWRRAGVLVGWMAPWFAMQFLASPLSLALHITGNVRTALGLQLYGLLLRVGSLMAVAATTTDGPLSECYALSGFVFYVTYLALVLKSTGVIPRSALSAFGKALFPIASWCLAGGLVVFLYSALIALI